MIVKPKISYYAHHMGSGHIRHAQRVIDTDAFEVQVTSTGPRKTTLLSSECQYVQLPSDVITGSNFEPVAGEYLHYAPSHASIVERFAALSEAWYQFRPDLVMVDVSVEVALFARLSGYRVAMRRMPGNRTDRAHHLGYSVADALFAYFPEELDDESYLREFGPKSHYLGTVAPTNQRLQGNSSLEQVQSLKSTARTVAVQTSLGASVPLSQIVAAAKTAPLWTWVVLGSVEPDTQEIPTNVQMLGVVEEPDQWMRQAEVIITSTGHNAVAAAAACRKPVIMIPENRPFEEQHVFARALSNTYGCQTVESWEQVTDWNALLDETLKDDPETLSRKLLRSPDGFAAALQEMVNTVLGCSIQ